MCSLYLSLIDSSMPTAHLELIFSASQKAISATFKNCFWLFDFICCHEIATHLTVCYFSEKLCYYNVIRGVEVRWIVNP